MSYKVTAEPLRLTRRLNGTVSLLAAELFGEEAGAAAAEYSDLIIRTIRAYKAAPSAEAARAAQVTLYREARELLALVPVELRTSPRFRCTFSQAREAANAYAAPWGLRLIPAPAGATPATPPMTFSAARVISTAEQADMRSVYA